MGFGSITYNSLVNSMTTSQITRFNNPFYKWSNKSPTKVTYWNINNKHTW